MAEMKESKKKIQLQVLTKAKPITTGVEDTLDTKYGSVKYTVHGDITKTAFLTYHDIGLNHESCFATFFNQLYQSDSFYDKFCVVHIDAPGHEYDASELKSDVAYFEMEELAEHVEQIAAKLNIKNFLGLGAGAGGRVLLAHALKYPARPRALVLFGASGRKCGWIEWVTKWVNLSPYMFKRNASDWWKQWLLTRWFSQATLNDNKDLLEMYYREVDRINQNNAFKYVQGFQRRKDILGELKKISCPVLMVVGDCTPLENESIEILDSLGPKSDLIQERDTGLLITVEKPQALNQPLKLLLQGMGYY